MTPKQEQHQKGLGKGLSEEKLILHIWAGYCSRHYHHASYGYPIVLECRTSSNQDNCRIVFEEVVVYIKTKKKLTEADGIPAEIVHAGAEAMVDDNLGAHDTYTMSTQQTTASSRRYTE